MYCTLIKKINVNTTQTLKTITNNKSNNLYSVGGANGFLQVINVDVTRPKNSEIKGPIKDPSQLNFSNTFNFYNNDITLITWNDSYNKLTTCDKSNRIVIWFNRKGCWTVESINQREVSNVSAIKWSKQGKYICILYEDGTCIVGNVEGQRMWGKVIKEGIYDLEWSPTGINILIACMRSNVLIVGRNGDFLGELEVNIDFIENKITTIEWWINFLSEEQNESQPKHLLLAYESGDVALYDDANDKDPIETNTLLSSITKAEWTLYGNSFAICGKFKKDNRYGVAFYSTDIKTVLSVIKCPEQCVSFCLSNDATKVGMLVSNGIFFGLIKPKYKWCYFCDTLVYSYINEDNHHVINFWNVKDNKHNYKYANSLIEMTAKSPFCIIATKEDEKIYMLTIYDCLGVALISKKIKIFPMFISLSDFHICVADRNYVYVWKYRSKNEKENKRRINTHSMTYSDIKILNDDDMFEAIFFIDDIMRKESIMSFDGNSITKDPILAMCISNSFIMITRASGSGAKIDCDSLRSFTVFHFDSRLVKIGISPNEKFLWGINDGDFVKVYDISKKVIEKALIERKDTWSVLWSSIENDKEERFCFLEKNKLNIVSNFSIEETIVCNSYLCEYGDMVITVAKMEKLMYKPWDMELTPEMIIERIETKVLRDLKEKMGKNLSSSEIYKFVNDHPNKKMWEMLSTYSLNNMDFELAEKAMMQTGDYAGLDFVKKVKEMGDENMKKAEVAQYLKSYEEAEKIYKDEKREDKNVEMNMKLGKWDKVVDILEEKKEEEEINTNDVKKEEIEKNDVKNEEEKTEEDKKEEEKKEEKKEEDKKEEEKKEEKKEEEKKSKKSSTIKGSSNKTSTIKESTLVEMNPNNEEKKENEDKKEEEKKKDKKEEEHKDENNNKVEDDKKSKMSKKSKKSKNSTGTKKSKKSSISKNTAKKEIAPNEEEKVNKEKTKTINEGEQKEENSTDNNKEEDTQNPIQKKETKVGDKQTLNKSVNNNLNESTTSKKENNNPNKSVNKSLNKSINKSLTKSVNKSIHKTPKNKSLHKSINKSNIEQSIAHDNNESLSQNQEEENEEGEEEENEEGEECENEENEDEENEEGENEESEKNDVVLDDNLKQSYNNLAEQLIESKSYDKAEKLLLKTNNVSSLTKLYFTSEQYDKATPLIEKTTDIPTLSYMASQFETYGLFDESVKCYLKVNDINKAIDICINMNKWELFDQIATTYDIFSNDEIVAEYAKKLTAKNLKMELVDFYIKTHRHYFAYKTLLDIANDLWRMKCSPLHIKKIYVFAALEMERYNIKQYTSLSSSSQTSSNDSSKDDNVEKNLNVDNLSSFQISNATQYQYNPNSTNISSNLHYTLTHKILNNIWKGAEAFHFYMLCQAQLYKKEYKKAAKTSLRLVLYEKELKSENVYALIALCAGLSQNLRIMSKAVSIIENENKRRYKGLGERLFANKEIVNKDEVYYKCPNEKCDGEISEYDIYCRKCGMNFDGCVISGESIITKNYFKCKRCRHKSLKIEAIRKSIRNCPMCHVSLLPH